MQRQSWGILMINLGLLAILAALVFPLLHVDARITRIVFTASTAIYVIGRVLAYPRGEKYSLHVKRLLHIEMASAVMFIVATFFFWYRPATGTDWVAFTLAGAILVIYTSIAIPRAKGKE